MNSAPSILDFGQDKTGLEAVLSGFVNKRKEIQETDALKQIYAEHQQQGGTTQDFLERLNTDHRVSPTKKVELARQALEIETINKSLEKEAIKAQAKVLKDQAKEQTEEATDVKELAFLEQIQGKNLSPTEIYTQARQHGIPRTRAKDLASLHRMEGKENRLSEADIAKQYDYELKDIDRQIKAAGADDEKKKPLEEERNKIRQMRARDINRRRKGETSFNLELYGDQPAVQPQQDPVIAALTKTFPPEQFNGVSKWDKDGNEYKSDGKTWKLVKK